MSYEGSAAQSSVPPASPTGSASPNRNVMVALSYLWLLALVPLFTEKEDKEVQWHAKNGLVLMGVEILAWVVLVIVGIVIAKLTFGAVGCIWGILELLVALTIVGLHVFCIVRGINGPRLVLPVISDLASKL